MVLMNDRSPDERMIASLYVMHACMHAGEKRETISLVLSCIWSIKNMAVKKRRGEVRNKAWIQVRASEHGSTSKLKCCMLKHPIDITSFPDDG